MHNRESGEWGRRARREGVAGNLRRRPFIQDADNDAVLNGVHAQAGSAGRSASGVKQSGFGREECLEEMLRFTQGKNIRVKLRHMRALPPR